MTTEVVLRYGWRFVLGGSVVVVATHLSQLDRPLLAGVAVLFPGITMTSYFLIGRAQGTGAMRAALPASTFTICSYLVLFGVMYVASYRLGVVGTLAVSFAAWLATTGVLFVVVS